MKLQLYRKLLSSLRLVRIPGSCRLWDPAQFLKDCENTCDKQKLICGMSREVDSRDHINRSRKVVAMCKKQITLYFCKPDIITNSIYIPDTRGMEKTKQLRYFFDLHLPTQENLTKYSRTFPYTLFTNKIVSKIS